VVLGVSNCGSEGDGDEENGGVQFKKSSSLVAIAQRHLGD